MLSTREKVCNIEEYVSEIMLEIIKKMRDLNITKHELQYELHYGLEFDDKNRSIKHINIVGIEFTPEFLMDTWSPRHTLRLNLSDGKNILLDELKYNQLSGLIIIEDELDELLAIKTGRKKVHTLDEKIHFENEDLIITDPCYIIKKKPTKPIRHYDENMPEYKDYNLVEKNGWELHKLTPSQFVECYEMYCKYKEDQEKWENEFVEEEEEDDWDKTDSGEDFETLGINRYLVSSTIYGDWSCTTFEKETKKELGKFCADAGMVAVFPLKDVLKYNPDFDYHINRPWTTTLIKNFTGDVWIEKRHHEGEYEETTEYYKKGEKWEEDTIHVVGEGNINFETYQTGF